MSQMSLLPILNNEPTHRFNVPDIVTKQLKFSQSGESRKIRVSSNFLRMYGFEAGKRIVTRHIHNGVSVKFDATGSQKIYERTYKHRRNAPTETVLELASKEIMSQFPSYMPRYHVTMKHGEIILKGIVDRAFSARNALRSLANPATMVAAMTSGVDIHSAQALGFTVKAVIEYRPTEMRDKTDKTEVGCLTAAANADIGVLFNEDIYEIDWRRAAELIDLPNVPVMLCSLQCDSFSTLAPKATREISINTTRDMFIPVLAGIRELQPAVIVFEQVAGFAGSSEYELLNIQLLRMGYNATTRVMDARDYGGITSRKRMYAVYSLFPNFELPEPTGRRENPIWNEVIAPRLHECRDVTSSKSLQKGAECGRLRTITRDKTYANTPVRSQSRCAKDSVVIEDGGRLYMPSESLLKDLLSIPQDFNTSVVGAESAVEIIGQSIEYGMHHKIMALVKKHILENIGHCTVSQFSNQGDKS